MKYPFLTNNELILVDFLPGSSGQLLMRLWSELDNRLNYNNKNILSELTINTHLATREIDYGIEVPKRITNWFLDKCDPKEVEDHLHFFEFLATFILSTTQRWNWNDKVSTRFYEDYNYQMKDYRILYGIHTWHKKIPFKQMQDLGYNIKCISIISDTDIGRKFQQERCQVCYPQSDKFWKNILPVYNNKNDEGVERFDFCTLLATKDSAKIVEWLADKLKHEFRPEKVERVNEILEVYYQEIVDRLN